MQSMLLKSNVTTMTTSKDHLTIATEQQLFFFHEQSPGSPFFLPHGTRLYQSLIALLRTAYRHRGYQEVMTPTIYSPNLWKQSGHWKHYHEHMFHVRLKEDENTINYALKPMNCPGHCLVFQHARRSYRELPLRLADFSVLHRNELSGTLRGLTRVRRFQQDDAHIFCTHGQLQDELYGCLDFLEAVYQGVFGFSFTVKLSTRPQGKGKYAGTLNMWQHAEAQLETALKRKQYEWDKAEGDGAFYGPKIDVYIHDALGRSHQCATVQLDFVQPERFNLQYVDDDDTLQRPVMIHRAIYGSLERFMAILAEHTQGSWPFVVNPRQMMLVPLAQTHASYANQVASALQSIGVRVDMDDTYNETLGKRLRRHIALRTSYILVIGDKEVASETVAVRQRDNSSQKSVALKLFLQQIKKRLDEKAISGL